MFSLMRRAHTEIQARVVRYYRTKEVVQTLALAHAQELRETPGELWPQVKATQIQEITAVRDGKYDIVDRRSFQYPYLPESLIRLKQPIMKVTPFNLRRFSETPIPRRAINLIKNGLLSLRWKVTTVPEVEVDSEKETRIRIATQAFKHPNNTDTWSSLIEQVVDDYLIGGYGTIEPRLTPYYKRPFKLWAVDGSTIRIFGDWTESDPDKPRYAQMTGLRGERGYVIFRDDELIYLRDNVRAHTPFGMGKLEVCFNAVNAFLGVQDMASKAGSNQVHKTWLWFSGAMNRGQSEIVRRHIRNEQEGQSQISIIAGMHKPEIVSAAAVDPSDLLLEWQEFLIRIIATGFDLSPLALGLERDVNRNTGEVLATSDFRSAVVPIAQRFQEALTRSIVHKFMNWYDLEFVFIGLDDPDMMTKMQIMRMLYDMDGVTTDEIREDMGRKELPSGWGRLTMTEKMMKMQEGMMLIQERAQKSMQESQQQDAGGMGGGFPGMPPGMGGGMPGGGGGGGKLPAAPKFPTMPKPPTAPKTPTPSAAMRTAAEEVGMKRAMPGGTKSPKEIAQMTPEDFTDSMNDGSVPKDIPKLKEDMEREEPGILETMSEDLRDYFDFLEEQQKELQVKPKKIDEEQEAEQEERFKKRELNREEGLDYVFRTDVDMKKKSKRQKRLDPNRQLNEFRRRFR